MAVSFIVGKKRSTQKKTANLSQVADKLYYLMLYRVHLTWAGVKLTTLVVIGIDCIGSYKSTYHTTILVNGCYIQLDSTLMLFRLFPIRFSITIQPWLPILVPHIEHGGYMSAMHVSPDPWPHFQGLLTLWSLCNIFVIRSVSPLPYN